MSHNHLRLLWFIWYLIYSALYLAVRCMVEISIFIRVWPYQVLFYLRFIAEMLEVDVSRLLAALTVLNIALHLN
jgi:hypothetical protein